MNVPELTKVTLFRTWVFLLGLAAANIAFAYLPIGSWTWTITYPIAFTMAFLIMVNFMRLRTSSRLIKLVAATGIFWLALWFSIGLADYLSRPEIYLP